MLLFCLSLILRAIEHFRFLLKFFCFFSFFQAFFLLLVGLFFDTLPITWLILNVYIFFKRSISRWGHVYLTWNSKCVISAHEQQKCCKPDWTLIDISTNRFCPPPPAIFKNLIKLFLKITATLHHTTFSEFIYDNVLMIVRRTDTEIFTKLTTALVC